MAAVIGAPLSVIVGGLGSVVSACIAAAQIEKFDGVRQLMSEWTVAETNTHQDHVIAHVIGATVMGYFVWDETAYLLLDIGFIWNIYLDGEMGLVPQSQAIAELEASEEFKREIKSDIDSISRDVADGGLQAISVPAFDRLRFRL